MEEYQSNSHKSREKREAATPPPKKVEAVVTGSRKKQSGFKKLADMFIKEDAHNVGTYILTDVLIPALVKTIVDSINAGTDMFFYGQAGRSRRNGVLSASTIEDAITATVIGATVLLPEVGSTMTISSSIAVAMPKWFWTP